MLYNARSGTELLCILSLNCNWIKIPSGVNKNQDCEIDLFVAILEYFLAYFHYA